MRIFKTRWFQRWARKEKLKGSALIGAVEEMEKGLIDADLGSGVYKKRVAQPGRGKSGSLRTLVAYRAEDRIFFMFGYAKNKRANVDDEELKILKLLAKELLAHSEEKLDELVEEKELFEVTYYE